MNHRGQPFTANEILAAVRTERTDLTVTVDGVPYPRLLCF